MSFVHDGDVEMFVAKGSVQRSVRSKWNIYQPKFVLTHFNKNIAVLNGACLIQ